MWQKNYLVYKKESVEKMQAEISSILAEIRQQGKELKASAVYLHLVFRGIAKSEGRAICCQLHRELPEAVFTGMTETLFASKEEEPLLRVNCSIFTEAHVQLLEYVGCPDHYREAGLALGRKLKACTDAKAAAVYCGGLSTEFADFMTALAQGNEDVLIFGAVAGVFEESGSVESLRADFMTDTNLFRENIYNEKEWQYVMGHDLYTMAVVVAVFSGPELKVQGDYVLGWKPLGKELTVTKAVGKTCIATLDDMPAVEIYRHYLNVTPDDNFVFNISEFPLLVERNGCGIARVPPVCDDEGRLYFNGDIYEGEKVRLTYAVHDELLHITDLASEKMCDFAPEGVFLTVCGNRNLFLRDEADKEIGYYRRMAENLIANYGTSELYAYNGQGGLLNSALVAVGMREGEIKTQPDCLCEFVNRQKKQRVKPLAARMATFLDATTRELAASNEELKKMAVAAKDASRAKSQFLSNMSHEIRTPINAILGMDEMILRECHDPVICEYAENIRTAGNTLLGLINDILDFSKIEAGRLEILPVEYALSSLLNDLVNLIAARAAKKGLAFHVEAAKDLPSILQGDELRLRQIVTNILTNAVKYTEKGNVTLKLDWEKVNDENIRLLVAVQDTGIGIKEEDKEKLFEAFERIEEERNRTIEGTGLGMNITQKLLKLMNSHLEVDSVYGEGSTFSFAVQQKVLNWSPMGNYEEAYRRTMAEHHVKAECFVAPEAKVLVVDDTPMNLTVVKGLLKQTQIQVDTAISGYECLEMAAKNKYDLIFLDHRMPGMDGLETLAALQKDKTGLNSHTPTVALTANAVSGAREEYMAAGFDDYLTKPISGQRLEACLLQFLPRDKVTMVSNQEQMTADEELPVWLNEVPGLDTESGIKHCGSKAAYLTALTVFAESLPGTAEEIERFFTAEDCTNYTTKVHALKSTAKVAGLMELSEKARRLESAGNNGYIEEIKQDTPIMLDLCRKYAEKLAPLVIKDEPAVKEPIAPEELAEAWESLREVAKAFDYDSLNYILTELSQYKLPDDDEKKLQALRQAADKLVWEEINKILS